MSKEKGKKEIKSELSQSKSWCIIVLFMADSLSSPSHPIGFYTYCIIGNICFVIPVFYSFDSMYKIKFLKFRIHLLLT